MPHWSEFKEVPRWAAPLAPRRLLTVSQYLELGEIEPGYSELVEGRVISTPSPMANHNWA